MITLEAIANIVTIIAQATIGYCAIRVYILVSRKMKRENERQQRAAATLEAIKREVEMGIILTNESEEKGH